MNWSWLDTAVGAGLVIAGMGVQSLVLSLRHRPDTCDCGHLAVYHTDDPDRPCKRLVRVEKVTDTGIRFSVRTFDEQCGCRRYTES